MSFITCVLGVCLLIEFIIRIKTFENIPITIIVDMMDVKCWKLEVSHMNETDICKEYGRLLYFDVFLMNRGISNKPHRWNNFWTFFFTLKRLISSRKKMKNGALEMVECYIIFLLRNLLQSFFLFTFKKLIFYS